MENATLYEIKDQYYNKRIYGYIIVSDKSGISLCDDLRSEILAKRMSGADSDILDTIKVFCKEHNYTFIDNAVRIFI